MHEFMLTYRPGVLPDDSQIQVFLTDFSGWCRDHGISHKLCARMAEAKSGVRYWIVFADLAGNPCVPYLDKAGFWPYGLTQVVRLRGQVAAKAVGWFAGLYARWSICVPPEFLTHSWSSAPDAFPGGSQ